MGTQEEDQEGTNADRRKQEGPEGSNTLSRPDRQDMSRPSITDAAPPHIVEEDDERTDGMHDERV